MPRIPVGPEALDKVFSLATPVHLYHKLLWELDHLNAALKSRDWQQHSVASYHAFNVAITAEHLIDWVWASSDHELRARMSKTLDNLPITSRRKLREAIGTKYRAIHVCGQIANGSKHYEMRHQDNDPSVGVSVTWECNEIANDDAYFGSTVLKVRDGADSRLATELFSEAVKAWDDLLRTWGYLEDRFVDSET